MWRILIENAPRKRAEMHGGRLERQNFDDVEAPAASAKLLALSEALTKLEAEDPVKAQLVTLCFFAGLSEEEAAGSSGFPAQAPRDTGVTPRHGCVT